MFIRACILILLLLFVNLCTQFLTQSICAFNLLSAEVCRLSLSIICAYTRLQSFRHLRLVFKLTKKSISRIQRALTEGVGMFCNYVTLIVCTVKRVSKSCANYSAIYSDTFWRKVIVGCLSSNFRKNIKELFYF